VNRSYGGRSYYGGRGYVGGGFRYRAPYRSGFAYLGPSYRYGGPRFYHAYRGYYRGGVYLGLTAPYLYGYDPAYVYAPAPGYDVQYNYEDPNAVYDDQQYDPNQNGCEGYYDDQGRWVGDPNCQAQPQQYQQQYQQQPPPNGQYPPAQGYDPNQQPGYPNQQPYPQPRNQYPQRYPPNYNPNQQ